MNRTEDKESKKNQRNIKIFCYDLIEVEKREWMIKVKIQVIVLHLPTLSCPNGEWEKENGEYSKVEKARDKKEEKENISVDLVLIEWEKKWKIQ